MNRKVLFLSYGFNNVNNSDAKKRKFSSVKENKRREILCLNTSLKQSKHLEIY